MIIEKELLNRNRNLDLRQKEVTEEIKVMLRRIALIKDSKAYKAWNRMRRIKIIIKKLILKPSLVFKFLDILIHKGYKEALNTVRKNVFPPIAPLTINEQYNIWLRNNDIKYYQLEQQSIESKKFIYKPKISLIVPTYNTNIEYFREMIESVLEQSYTNWELCIADDASTDENLKNEIINVAKNDNRIKYTFRGKNGHICAASNSALEFATGEFIGLLDHDDILKPNALYENVKIMQEAKDVDLLYSDEDKIELDGKTRVDPFMKPDWSPDFIRSINYITHFCVIRKEIIDGIGGFRLGTQGAQDWDIILRATTNIENTFQGTIDEIQHKKIIHIPKVLYSWRKSETSTASETHIKNVKNYAFVNQREVLEEDLKRRGLNGEVIEIENALGLWYERYEVSGNPKVSVIIPTKDKYEYISKCLESIYEKTTYKNFEIVIVDTGSTESKVFQMYEKYSSLYPETFKVIKWEKTFNFAAVCNSGSKATSGMHLLFLNNDTEIVTPSWIEDLLIFSQQERIGAVGAKLLYPNGLIQHAGIVTGMGVASHYMQRRPDNVWQSFPMLYAKDSVRDVSGVTGACLMIKKELFFKNGMFNEKYRIAYNDVDFCLKLFHKFGKWNIYNPNVVLIHHESISVGVPEKGTRNANEFQKENGMMYEEWGEVLKRDPFYNPSLTLKKEDFSLDI